MGIKILFVISPFSRTREEGSVKEWVQILVLVPGLNPNLHIIP